MRKRLTDQGVVCLSAGHVDTRRWMSFSKLLESIRRRVLRKHPAWTLLLSMRNPKSLWAADLPRPRSRRAFVFITNVCVCNAQPRRTEKSFKFHTLQKRMCFLAPIVQVTTARTNQLVHWAEGTEDTRQGHSPPRPGDTVSVGLSLGSKDKV